MKEAPDSTCNNIFMKSVINSNKSIFCYELSAAHSQIVLSLSYRPLRSISTICLFSLFSGIFGHRAKDVLVSLGFWGFRTASIYGFDCWILQTYWFLVSQVDLSSGHGTVFY